MIWPTDILAVETWVLIGTLLALFRYYLHRKWSYFKKLNIPYDPPSLLGLGNMMDVVKKKPFTYELEAKEKYGPVFGFFFGTTPFLTVYDIDMLRQIFQIPDRSLDMPKLAGKELNSNLTAVSGAKWKRQRATMTPSFSTSKLKEMTGIIEWCVDNTIKLLHKKNKTGNGTFNVKESFSRLSLDIVLSAAFSTKVQSQDDTKEEPEISVQAKKLFKRNIFSLVLVIYFLIPPSRKFLEKMDISIVPKAPLKYFARLTNSIIERRKDSNSEYNRVDFMQLLLDAEISEEDSKKNPDKGMTRNEIVGNSLLMILAGYENTANTMNYLAYNLATHPEIQTKVQNEIDEMVESHGKFDYEGVTGLKYLDMCLNETLRLYIPILRNARTSGKDFTINGLTIPAKTLINIPSRALAHDPKYWDEPSEFRPERMRDMSQIDSMLFQPFGAGPRNCIGMRFAQMEVKITISKILHEFTLLPASNTPTPPLELTTATGMKPKVDYDLRAVPRAAHKTQVNE